MDVDLKEASDHLSRNDIILEKIITEHRIDSLSLRQDYYSSLVKSVIGQQLSTKAASTIFERLEKYVDNKIDPITMLESPEDEFRLLGISRQKCNSIKNIAQYFLSNGSIDFSQKKDEEIIKELTKVNGIGIWTAQMFLIFSLGRLDIMPLNDTGFLKSIRIHYNIHESLLKSQLSHLSEKWKPFRSVAALYLWKSLDAK